MMELAGRVRWTFLVLLLGAAFVVAGSDFSRKYDGKRRGSIVRQTESCDAITKCSGWFRMGSRKTIYYKFLDNQGTKVGYAFIQPKPNYFRIFFRAEAGYKLVSAAAGVWREADDVPSGDDKFQEQRTPGSVVGGLNLKVSYADIIAPYGASCCGHEWFFALQAEIQEGNDSATAALYSPPVSENDCIADSNSFTICPQTLRCRWCPICRDDALGELTDNGCPAELPYCDSGDGGNDGDNRPGRICRLCEGGASTVDVSCSVAAPTCVDEEGNEVAEGELGDECVCLLDSAACLALGEVFDATACACVPCLGDDDDSMPDSGCDVANPTCVDSSDMPVGIGEAGEQCVCLLDSAACLALGEVFDATACACVPCIGDDDDSMPDSGCDVASPTCVDSSDMPVGIGEAGEQCACLETCDDDLLPDLNLGTCSCECLNPCKSFTQVGQDVDANALADSNGSSVEISADGTRLVVGAYRAGAGDRGQVKLYELRSGTWVQRGATIEGDASFDRMGWSADITPDGTRIAAGATQNDGGDRNAGVVRIYDLDDANDTLVQVGGDILGVNRDGLSGSSVALSDDGMRVAIGATNNDEAGFLKGQVRVWEYDSANDVWTQLGSSLNGDRGGDRMGQSVALSSDGNRLAIGTNKALNSQRQDTGVIKVFDLVNGDWAQVGSSIYGRQSDGSFAFNMALSADGTILASGSSGVSGGGLMQVFQFSDADDDWVQLGEDILPEANNDAFGIDVDMTPDGNTIAVGANRNDGNGFNSGSVRIYNLVNGEWVQVSEDIDGENRDDLSGGQVSITADGKRVAIGAQAALVGDTTLKGGHVRVFDEGSDICCSV